MSAASMSSRFFTNYQNRLLVRIIKDKEIPRAVSEFHRMCEGGLLPTPMTFSKMITACTAAGSPQGAEQCFALMEEKSITPNTIVFSSLIHSYTTHGLMDKAQLALTKMREANVIPNTVIYNTLLHGYISSKRLSEAEEVLRQMEAQNIERDALTFNTLLDGYAREGQLEQTERLLSEMRAQGLPPDVYTYSSLIRSHCHSGQLSHAFAVIERMTAEGVHPNLVTYSTLIDACVKMKQMERAEEVLAYMEARQVVPNHKTFSSLIHGYAITGQFAKAWQQLERMEERGIHPDVVVYTSLIGTHARAQNMNQVKSLLDRMKSQNLEVTPLIWNSVASGFALVGDVERAEGVLQFMNEKNHKVNVTTLNSLMRAYASGERLADAQNMLRQMRKRFGCRPDVASFNVLLGALGREGRIEGMMDLLDDMMEQSVTPSSMSFFHLLHGTAQNNTDMHDLFLGNIEAMMEQAKSMRLYINRATVNYVVGQLVTAPGVEKESIDLALRFVRQLRGTGTLPNSFTFAQLFSGVQSSGSAAQQKLVETFMREAHLTSSHLAQAQGIQESIAALTSHQLQDHLAQCLLDERHEEAEQVINTLRKTGTTIPDSAADSFLRLTLKQNNVGVDEAQFEFSALREQGIKPSVDLFLLLTKKRGLKPKE